MLPQHLEAAVSPHPALQLHRAALSSHQSSARPAQGLFKSTSSSSPYVAAGGAPAEQEGAAASASDGTLLFPNSITMGFPCSLYPFTNSIAS